MTPTQQSIVDQLTAEYGMPDRVLVNDDSIYVAGNIIVRLDWFKQERCLCILPNGDRLTWTHPHG